MIVCMCHLYTMCSCVQHCHDVATAALVEEVSSYTLSRYDCTGQHHHFPMNPGGLEAEIREAILRVKRQTSPAAFHAPMRTTSSYVYSCTVAITYS